MGGQRWWAWGVLSACGADPVDSEPVDGACGDVTVHNVTVLAAVVDGAGAPVEGASVRVEERAWDPGILGQALTAADGEARLADLTVTSVDGCWGTALDYVLVAEKGGNAAEDGINSRLFTVVSEGAGELDRRDRPLVLP